MVILLSIIVNNNAASRLDYENLPFTVNITAAVTRLLIYIKDEHVRLYILLIFCLKIIQIRQEWKVYIH